jgi:O-antigen ligase
LLPTQFGKHFWPDFTIVSGIRIDYLSPTLYVTDIVLFLLFGCFLFRKVTLPGKLKFKSLNVKAQFKSKKLLIFLGLVLFFSGNVLFSARPLLSVYGVVKLSECVFLSLYLSKIIFSKVQLQQIVLLFSVGGLFEAFLAIVQYMYQGSVNGIFYFFGERTFTGATPGIANVSINGTLLLRPYATFSHPNVLAAYLLVILVFVWSFLLKTRQALIRSIAVSFLLVGSVALLLTYSRVAILLWILLVVMLFFKTGYRTVKTIKARIILSVAVLIILVIINLFPLTHELYFRFSNTSLSDESITQRTELLVTSWQIIRLHPFTGVGLLNFIPSLAPLQKPLPLGLYLQPVHNIFVLITAETGFIGSGIFVFFLIATILRIRKQKPGSNVTFFVLVSIILITGMFDHYWITLQQGQLLFATVIGLSWAKVNDTV